MDCPVCKNVSLHMSERLGVEIDYCPQCRGVWLDRGELDKIIEKSEAAAIPTQPPAAARQAGREAPRDERYYRDDRQHYKKKKHKSLLSELFDFG